MGYTPGNDAELERAIAQFPELKEAALSAADKIASIARANGPVGASHDYVDGIDVEETKTGARVVASAPVSAFVEFGVPTYGQPARFNLRQAVVTAGYKFTKRG